MAYVGAPFDHDIFVSYSHGADADGEPLLKDWSVAFVRALEAELRADREYRNTLSMFLDAHDRPGRRLDPMAPLAGQLEAHVGASALLMVLLSPDYQASAWCRTEREWWWARQSHAGLPPEGRVAMVRTWPLKASWPGDRWPPELSDRDGNPLVGLPFHVGEGRAARPKGWTEWQSGFGPEVREALLVLAGEIYTKLDRIKADAERLRQARADAERLNGAAGQTLYVHGRTDGAADWERVATALQADGYAVLPGVPDPLARDPAEREALRERRVETMTACDALVLVGSQGATSLDADLIAVGRNDRQSARSRSNRWLPCALLDTAGAAIDTPVRRANARIVQTDWLDATREAPGAVVRRWLADKAAQAMQP